jgi:transposase
VGGGSCGLDPAGATVGATDGEAIDRSQGGTEHEDPSRRRWAGPAVVDPVNPGQAGDNPQLLPLLDAICSKTPGPGRARKRPDVLIADKGYARDPTRRELRRRIRHTIPERIDQIARRAAKGSTGGRPPALDRGTYRHRNVVERCFNRLRQWRDLASRFAKRVTIRRSCLVLIAALIWLR